MGDANPIRTPRDHSKPSHEGYRNIIELPAGNNMVPLRSDTIRPAVLNPNPWFDQHHYNPPQATKQQSDYHDDKPELNKEEERGRPENISTNPSTPPALSILFITEKVLKLNSFFKSLGLVPKLSGIEFVYTKGDDGDVMFIKIFKKDDGSHKEEPKAKKISCGVF
ncbi:hypothetical protein Tco_0038216 [Tanacetum coccineum]